MERTIFYTDSKGNKVPIPVNVNKDLRYKTKKNSKLAKAIATKALVLTLGAGIVIGAGSFLRGCSNIEKQQPTTSTIAPTSDEKNNLSEWLRFDPNSKESIVNNAVLLIEEAAMCGKELDAEDAVLAVIAANSDELSAGFVGELFGEKENQTYTYSSIVDAYLRVCMMQNENVGFADNGEITFNIENIFASEEDYNFLCNIRDLTTRYNNAKSSQEKAEIAKQLNEIAANLCGYDVYNISSAAGIVSMLTLDGMRTTTITSADTILPDDIRDEMFGNGDYACTKNETTTKNGKVLQTAYSFRVSDLKLDTIKTKLENATLGTGKAVILDEIIAQVSEQTKDVEIADIDIAGKINSKAEENRTITYDYETKPGTTKDDFDEKTNKDKVTQIDGKDVIVEPGDKKPKDKKPSKKDPSDDETTKLPEMKEEDDVKPNPEDKIHDDRDDAKEQLEEDWEKAQKDSDQGCKDGTEDGKSGKKKRNLSGKSQYYINAYNVNYEFWYNEYLNSQKTTTASATTTSATTAATTEVEILGNLSKEQLEELKAAAMNSDEFTQDEEVKPMQKIK